jgi:hypothetical protein
VNTARRDRSVGEVIVGDRRVEMSRLVLDDQVVVDAIRTAFETGGAEEVDGLVRSGLSIGVRAMADAGGRLDSAALQEQVDRLGERVDGATTAAVDAVRAAVERAVTGDGSTLGLALDQRLTALSAGLEDLLAGEDAPVRAAIRKTVHELASQMRDEVVRVVGQQDESLRKLLSNDAATSPLAAVRAEVVASVRDESSRVVGELALLREAVATTTAVRATMERTAIKGADYEAAVGDQLEHVVRSLGDLVDATGAVPGLLGRSKKGDFVTQLAGVSQDVKVVVEAKDSRLSPAAWRRELEEAASNRGAAGAIGVVRSRSSMPGEDLLRCIGPAMYLVVFDPENGEDDLLVAVYQLVRAQALAASIRTEAGTTLAVQQEIERALDCVGQMQKILRAAEQIKVGASSISSEAAGVREALEERLHRAMRLLGDGEVQEVAA